VDQRLVVAVLVDGRELQVAVQVQPSVASVEALGQRDVLVAAPLVQRDRVLVELLQRASLDPSGEGQGSDQHERRGADQRAERDLSPSRQRPAEQRQHDDARERVDHADGQRGADLAQRGQDQEREGQARHDRPQVVGGQQISHGGPDRLRAGALEEHHEQRDLRADEQPTSEAVASIAGWYRSSQAKATYSPRADRPPASATSASTTRKASTGRPCSGLVSRLPRPIVVTKVARTSDVCSTVLPISAVPSAIRISS
jgi:hypothetical protein